MLEPSEMDNLLKAIDVLKALSNPHRLAIMCRLRDREMNVTEIAQNIGLSQSALSQHLGKLRQYNLVNTRRDRQTIYYSLENNAANEIIKLLHTIYCNSDEK